MSGSLEGVPKHAIDGRRRPVPFLDLYIELSSSLGRGAVVPRAAVVLARPPFGADPSAPQHRLERGVEGSLVDVEDVARDLAQLERESPPVHGFLAEQLEREHFEGAADYFGAGLGAKVGGHGPLDYQKGKMVERGRRFLAPF